MEQVLARMTQKISHTHTHNLLIHIGIERERKRGKRKAKALVGSESDLHDTCLSHCCTHHQVCNKGWSTVPPKNLALSGPCTSFFQSLNPLWIFSMLLCPSIWNRWSCHAFRHRREHSYRQTQQATPAGGRKAWAEKRKPTEKDFFKCGTANPLLTAKLDPMIPSTFRNTVVFFVLHSCLFLWLSRSLGVKK